MRTKIEQGVKLVLLGEMSAGKTSVVLRLVKNTFPDKVEPTIGAAFMVHKMQVEDRSVKLEIWDTAGQELYRSLAPMYYRGASAAVIVYDITKKDSFETMKRWVDELKVRAPQNIVLAIAGNKLDLESERAVPTKLALEYLRQIEEGGGDRPIFCECSAKTGEGIGKLFSEVCQRLIQIAESEGP
jgi:Ras-related protein Rab-5C